MKKSIVKKALNYWYLTLIIGILYLILGIWAFITPLSSFLAMTVFLSAGILIIGIAELVYAIANRKRLDNWGWSLIGGILNLVIGVYLLSNPGLSALMLSVFIGLWLLFRSVMAIINAFEIKRMGTRKWGWVLATGILGVLFSALLLWNPIITGMTVGIWIGIGLVTVGLLHVLLSLILRKVKQYRDELEGRLDDYVEVN
ncbi:HdeD family acid-resistance protein [Parapedobacter deserti]|uniref:HdeD family acid-resistance protein n=1 Tax=Parapedobacter deserti TaxID=1912957 RepID=A0ABV7JMS8_9SPHI